MSPLLRGSLAAASLAGAFAAGYFLKPIPTIASATAAPPIVAAAPTPASKLPSVRVPDAGPSIQFAASRIPEVLPPSAGDLPPIVMPSISGTPELVPIIKFDPTDPGFQMIKRELGIKTTVLDKSEPQPAVLVDAQKSETAPPIPIGAPMPRLDPPPLPDMPIPTRPFVADLPSPPRPITLVNTRAIALDFELTRIGTSNVTAVELWTTRDGGATWAHTDRMDGSMPPFRTRLGSDGEYGFRLVCESAAGLRTPEPKRGDQPDLRLELDTTPPKVTGLSLAPVEGSRDKVRIRWEMSDAHLDHECVKIEFSTDGREWRPALIDPQIPHDSKIGCSRVWIVPPGLSHQVMIRVTARDKAGNEATAELPNRVSIDLVAPEGKLTGVRSAEPEVGPMPRVVPADLNRYVFSFYVGMFDGR